jgi:monoamine oxidase
MGIQQLRTLLKAGICFNGPLVGVDGGDVSQLDVIIVGAGLAGLCCAKELHPAGISFLLLEKHQRTGGRVQTEHASPHPRANTA